MDDFNVKVVSKYIFRLKIPHQYNFVNLIKSEINFN